MHGLHLDSLIPHYVDLRARVGLDVLCVQEDRYVTAGACERPRPSARIADALGPGYAVARHDDCPGLAVVHDTRTLACGPPDVVALPRLASLGWFERRYIVGGKAKQKHALVLDVQPRGALAPFTLACFHLDTAGGNAHRLLQTQAIAGALDARGAGARFIACGDSNAFAWRRQTDAIGRLLAPLAALGGADPERAPTHYFARQREPKLPHRVGVLLGKLGIDRPGRYDVVCATLPARARGQIVTPASDHDLVWAVF